MMDKHNASYLSPFEDDGESTWSISHSTDGGGGGGGDPRLIEGIICVTEMRQFEIQHDDSCNENHLPMQDLQLMKNMNNGKEQRSQRIMLQHKDSVQDDEMLNWPSQCTNSKELNLSLPEYAPQPATKYQDSSFINQFNFFQDNQRHSIIENEFPPLEMDFSQLDEIERRYTQPNALGHFDNVEPMSRTQIAMPKNLTHDHNEVLPKSCPISRTTIVHPVIPQPSTVHGDVQNYLYDFLAETDDNGKETTLNNSNGKAENKIKQNDKETDITKTPIVNDILMATESIMQLYRIIRSKYSDFAFVYALSAQLCQDRVPMECWVHVKMGLLLSLASTGPNPNRSPIPIVVYGGDSYMAHKLLNEISALAQRNVAGPSEETRSLIGRGGVQTHRHRRWFEADPIILAKGGVCYMGNWSRLKPARADNIFKVVECSRIAIELSASSGEASKTTTTLYNPLQTAIWTYWRPLKKNSREQQTFNKFVKIFGILLFMDEDNHNVMLNFVLNQASTQDCESTVDHLSISSDDMRQFLMNISQRSINMMPETGMLLQKYFVASRIERPDCLTKQSFVVLKQFAESFAKLALRNEVLSIDAIAAIYMCEHFVQQVFGRTEGPNAPPLFQSHNFIGLVDENIIEFKKWLLRYIDKYYTQD